MCSLVLLCSAPVAFADKDVERERCVFESTNRTAYDTGNEFSGKSKVYSTSLVKSMISAMTHSCFVSQGKEKWTEKNLRDNQWDMIGSLITPKKSEFGELGRAYVAYKKALSTLVIVFRGSGVKESSGDTIRNALTDAKMVRGTIGWLPDKKQLGKWKGLSNSSLKAWYKVSVHNGFNREYERFLPDVDKRVRKLLKKHTPKYVYCIGFSLGAALATHCGLHMKFKFGISPEVIAGASPRVGDKKFRKSYEKTIPNIARIMLEKDPIPQLPGNNVKFTYAHAGILLPLYSGGKKTGKRMSKKAVQDRRKRTKAFSAKNFVEFHDNIKYKQALLVHLSDCQKKRGFCTGNKLKKLADAERGN
jgi:hypothetical protein